MKTSLPAAAGLAWLAGAAPGLPAGGADPLAAHRWTDRVLVALAPSAADPPLAEQRRLFARMGAGARERALVLVVGIDGTPEGAELRRRFGGGARFRAVLVGKDGGEKLAADRPLGGPDLFPVIDAMPMRREETGAR